MFKPCQNAVRFQATLVTRSKPSTLFSLSMLSLVILTMALGRAPDARAQDQTGTNFPGTIQLEVDLSDAARKIFVAHETIPVKPGHLVLHYPKWIPGEHSPSGTIASLTALTVQANGKALPWRRQLTDMYAIETEIPAGVTRLEVNFQFLSPIGGGEFGQSTSATPQLAELEWNQVLFYPDGYPVNIIPVKASAKIPAGWDSASALTIARKVGSQVEFAESTVEQLIDSPIFIGKYVRHIDLAPGASVPVHLHVFGDRPANLEVNDTQIRQHLALVQEARALFQSQHYQHYDFLLAVSDNTGNFGLEHHQSSDDRIDAEFFTEPELYLDGGGLLPHEYVHSWNGKFRRPIGLATPDYHTPMKGDLLWVYEGLTQYLGDVLTARSGIWNQAQYREKLAMTAAQMQATPGRRWRPLQDTADDAQLLYYSPEAWANWRRKVDFYPEGELLWLDVDTRIRELSQDKRSIDNFVAAFYGTDDGQIMVKPYNFDDIVNALESIQAGDWRNFLTKRLTSTQADAPLDGLQRGGWKLDFDSIPSASFKANERETKQTLRTYSVGLAIANGDNRGTINDVIWGSAAFDAGMAPGMKLMAVNGEAYTPEVLDAAIAEAAVKHQAIDLLVRNVNSFSTVHLPYFGGPKFPILKRLDNSKDRIEEIARAKRTPL